VFGFPLGPSVEQRPTAVAPKQDPQLALVNRLPAVVARADTISGS